MYHPPLKDEFNRLPTTQVPALHYAAWLFITILTGYLSVVISSYTQAYMIEVNHLRVLPFRISSQEGEIFNESLKIIIISWIIFPGLMVSSLQSFVLIVYRYLGINFPVFFLSVFLTPGIYLISYLFIDHNYPMFSDPGKLPELLVLLGVISIPFTMVISIIHIYLLRPKPLYTLWAFINILGYSLGWGIKMYFYIMQGIWA